MDKLKFKIISLARKFKGNISLLLMAVLVVLLLLEAWVIKGAFSTVLGVARSKPEVQTAQLVRINFPAYDKVVSRLQSPPDYISTITIPYDAFGIGSTKK